MQGTRDLAARNSLGGTYPGIGLSKIGSLAFVLSLAGALALLAGCATTGSVPPLSPPTSEPSATGTQTGANASPVGTAAGTWLGTTTSNSDGGNGVRKITMRMTQNGGGVSGDYSCEAGNTACRNLDDSGSIQGK